MSRGVEGQKDRTGTEISHNKYSGHMPATRDERATSLCTEDAIRSRVVTLLDRSYNPAEKAAASELEQLINSEGMRGKLVRAALIEELV